MQKQCILFVIFKLLILAAQAESATVGDERILAESWSAASPVAACGSGVYLVVWNEEGFGLDTGTGVLGLRLDTKSLAPADERPIRITKTPGHQAMPCVAHAGGKFLVAWEDFRNGRDLDISLSLVDAETGRVTESKLSVVSGEANQARPSLCGSANGFLLVWQEADRTGQYGIRGQRISSSGNPVGPVFTYSNEGASPRLVTSGRKALVSWTTGTARGVISASLVNPSTGVVEKSLGPINSCCPEDLEISHVGGDNFWVVSAREGFPNPWGWPGPGAVTFSRVMPDGSLPDAALEYGPRYTKLSEQAFPTVVDAASWGDSGFWNAGIPGGFPGTRDGLWPHGMPSIAFDGRHTVLFAWVKGVIGEDRLSLSGFDVWVKGVNSGDLREELAEFIAAGDPHAGEMLPSLVSDGSGVFLLLYLKVYRDQPRLIAARRITLP